MAIFCLATDIDDLKRRLGNIIVAQKRDRKPVRASDLKAHGPMAALLKDAIAPNLVQTLENNPAFIHGGPFANIAHGCNSVLATKTALKLADYVVTEAGFGADLGAEKFLDIKCRKAGLKPDCVVLVATIRALKMHGGVAKEDLKAENVAALQKGFANLERHVRNVREQFGLPVVISINRFSADTEGEVKALLGLCDKLGVECILADHWANGGAGAAEVAKAVVRTVEKGKSEFRFLYPDEMPLWEKVKTIATKTYGASDITADQSVRNRFKELQQDFGNLPVCMAKTQYSFSTDAALKGAPSGHVLPIREVRLSAGAEFVVVICGDIMTMPGLPKVPSANNITVDKQGRISGLF
jgi:formate--tetrahydrofolate ligase